MKVILDENGYVTSYAIVGELANGIEVEEPEDMAHFESLFSAYCRKEDALFFNSEKAKADAEQSLMNSIRIQREMRCFPIINRGALWYEKLTEMQRTELAEWYEAWLDAPATGSIPQNLEWIT